jgi:hypothetical protein
LDALKKIALLPKEFIRIDAHYEAKELHMQIQTFKMIMKTSPDVGQVLVHLGWIHNAVYTLYYKKKRYEAMMRSLHELGDDVGMINLKASIVPYLNCPFLSLRVRFKPKGQSKITSYDCVIFTMLEDNQCEFLDRYEPRASLTICKRAINVLVEAINDFRKQNLNIRCLHLGQALWMHSGIIEESLHKEGILIPVYEACNASPPESIGLI